MLRHVFLQTSLLSFLRWVWNAIAWILLSAFGVKGSKAYGAQDLNKLKPFTDIPGPRARPFIGTIFTSGCKKDLIKHSKGYLSKYGSLVREEWYWNYPLIVVYDPDDIETVLSTTKYIRPGLEIMKRRYKKVPEGTKQFGGGMANANGTLWGNFRNASKYIQSTPFLETFIPNGNKIADHLVGILYECGPFIEDFSLFLTRSAIENNFQLCFGQKVGILQKEQVNPDPRIRQFELDMTMFWDSINESIKGYPWWKHFNTRIWENYTNSETSLYQLENSDINNIPPSYMLYVLFITETTKTCHWDALSWWIMQSEHFQNCEQYDALFEYCVATQSLIAKDNLIQDKLYEELKSILPDKHSQLNASDIKKLAYLKACITEAFRMAPISPNLCRISEEEMVLKGHRIPPHTLLLCQTWYNCLQEENFYRATEFRPERWMENEALNENVNSNFVRRTRIMTHFGTGRRSCPAEKFALQKLMITLAKVFRHFHLHFPEDLSVTYKFLQSPTNVPLKLRIEERPD